MKPATRLSPILLVLLISTSLSAQTPDPSILTVDRIFNSAEFRPDGFGPARWLISRTPAAITGLSIWTTGASGRLELKRGLRH